MPRKSRYPEGVTRFFPDQNYIHAAIYTRLSKADGDEESESIHKQLEIGNNYIFIHPEMRCVKVYKDDGYTGQHFQRPGFQEMLRDIKAGVINCVIVKDTSRIGRNYIQTGDYLLNVFPEFGVRFISINDAYDSEKDDSELSFLKLVLHTLLDDRISKNLSHSISLSINAQMEKGEFLPAAGSIPYGYLRDVVNNTYIVDEEAAPVILKIFNLRAAGMGFATIADQLNKEGMHLGEWLEPEEFQEKISAGKKPSHPEEATAYLHLAMTTMAEIAGLLGKTAEKETYEKYADGSRKAYNHLFVKTGTLDTDRQAKIVRPLALGLLEGEEKNKAEKRLVKAVTDCNYHVGTGFLSTAFLLGALTEAGEAEVAYKLLENTEKPGWLAEVLEGATTVWETWEGNVSRNHYSPGAVCQWLFDTVAGIRPDGENRFVITPVPGGTLTHAKASYRSIYGTVESGWEKNENKPVSSGDYTWSSSYENGIWTYDLNEVWTGLKTALSGIEDRKNIKAMGISAMMHGYLAFDKDWNLLVPFRTWQNTITGQAAEEGRYEQH